MKLELELGTNELGHELVEQFFIWKLKQIRHDLLPENNRGVFLHPDDKKQNKKLVKACNLLLEYYGVEVDA